MKNENGILADLTNPYCRTEEDFLFNIQVCFESALLNRCFNGLELLPDQSEIDFYIQNNYLWVTDVNTSMNKTLINMFCLSNYSIQCDASPIKEIMILNSELSKDPGDNKYIYIVELSVYISFYVGVCGNCSTNAICEEGLCVCKPSYSGDGMICNGK